VSRRVRGGGGVACRQDAASYFPTPFPASLGSHSAAFSVLRGNEGGHSSAILPFLAVSAPSAIFYGMKRVAPPQWLFYGPVAAAGLHIYDRVWMSPPTEPLPVTGMRRRAL
jgi:hypothetical protein